MWIFINIMIVITFFSTLFWILRIKYQKDLAPSKKFPQGRMIAEIWQGTGSRPRKLVPLKANGFEVQVATEHDNPSRYFFSKEAVGSCKYPAQPLFPFSFLQADAKLVSWVENCPIPINPKVVASYNKIETSFVCPNCQHKIDKSELLGTAKAVFTRDAIADQIADESEENNTADSDDKTTKSDKSDKVTKSKKKLTVAGLTTNGPIQVVVTCPECRHESNIVSFMEDHSIVEEQNLEYESMMTSEGFAMLQDTDGLALGQTVNEEGGEELRLARDNRLNKNYLYGLMIVAALGAIGAAIFAYQSYTAVVGMGG
jgi:hypothetical protein